MSIEEIGSAAGKIWQYLSDNGPVSATKLATDTGLDRNDVQRAIGWLAREEKIEFVMKGRVETIALKSS